MPLTAVMTWDPLSGSDQTGISDGCDESLSYAVTVYDVDKAVVHQKNYSTAKATVENLVACSKYTGEVMAFNKLQSGGTVERVFETVENGKNVGF